MTEHFSDLTSILLAVICFVSNSIIMMIWRRSSTYVHHWSLITSMCCVFPASWIVLLLSWHGVMECHGVSWWIMVSCGLCKECCNNDCHVPAPGGCGLDTRGRKEGQRRNWCWHAPVAPVGARVWSRSRHQLDKWHNYADTGPVVATVAAGGRCLVTCGAWTWSCHDHVISPSNTSHNHKLSHLHL